MKPAPRQSSGLLAPPQTPAEARGEAEQIIALELAGNCVAALGVTREALARSPEHPYLLARIEVLTEWEARLRRKANGT